MDVIFIILVFFVYSIFDMTVHKGVKVELPKAAGTHEKGELHIITIKPDNTLQLDNDTLSREELLKRISAEYRANTNSYPILISGDSKASLGNGIELLSELQKIGIEKISFQVSGKEDAGE